MKELLNDIKIEVLYINNKHSTLFTKKIIIYLPVETSIRIGESTVYLISKYINPHQLFLGDWLDKYWGDVSYDDKYVWKSKILSAESKEILDQITEGYIKDCKAILIEVINKNLSNDLLALTNKYDIKKEIVENFESFLKEGIISK